MARLTDIESTSGDSSDKESDDEKVQSEDESSESDSEYESPSYDKLVKLLNKYTKVIRKTRITSRVIVIVNMNHHLMTNLNLKMNHF